MNCLETNRLLLRPFSPSDLDYLHELWKEPLVRRYLWDDQVISRDEAATVIEASLDSFEKYQFGFWRIGLKSNQSAIGFCGLRHSSDEQFGQEKIELLYGLNPESWGKGLAVEAAQAVLRYGFEYLELAAIYAGADPPNKASFRVMERLGMHFDHVTKLNSVTACYYVITREVYFTGQTLQWRGKGLSLLNKSNMKR